MTGRAWWWIGLIAALLVVGFAWKEVLWPPPAVRHPCWILSFQNGDQSRVCCDHLTTAPDPALSGYFIVTAYNDSDQPVGTYTWVTRCGPEGSDHH